MTEISEICERRLAGIQRQIELLKAQEHLLLELMGEPRCHMGRAPQSSVKEDVLSMLIDAGKTGLNASEAISLADKNGVTLRRGTVSSLLSRLKNEGTVTHDGERYRLP